MPEPKIGSYEGQGGVEEEKRPEMSKEDRLAKDLERGALFRAMIEAGPERILSREEVLSELGRRCEFSGVHRELVDAGGVYLLEVMNKDKTKIYIYQRQGSFAGGVESALTTIQSEDMDDGFPRTLADYDPKTGQWVDQ
jgi:hypothetical protein